MHRNLTVERTKTNNYIASRQILSSHVTVASPVTSPEHPRDYPGTPRTTKDTPGTFPGGPRDCSRGRAGYHQDSAGTPPNHVSAHLAGNCASLGETGLVCISERSFLPQIGTCSLFMVKLHVCHVIRLFGCAAILYFCSQLDGIWTKERFGRKILMLLGGFARRFMCCVL